MSIHDDPGVQHVDVRFYFDGEEDPEQVVDDLSEGIQNAAELSWLQAAYQLVDGRPDDGPLA